MKLLGAFTDHPASVNETYFQHMGMAFGFGGRMLVAGLACVMHGLFPFLFVRTGSKTIAELHGRMVTHRTVQPPRDAAVARS
jgi:hypothetical protein